MNAGLPGIGLSGVFYILSALLMPLAEVGRMVSGRPRRRPWATVLGHWTIAVGMIAAMYVAGHGLTFVLRTAGYHVKDGNLWASVGFALVPFVIVFSVVTLVTSRSNRATNVPTRSPAA